MTLVPYTDNETPTGVGRPENLQVSPNPDATIPNAPTVWQTFAAAFRQENSIVSAISSNSFYVDEMVKDPTLNVWDEIKGTKYEDYFDRFADKTTRAGVRAIKADIDREEQDRLTLAMGGGTAFLANMIAGTLDWTTLIPIAKGSQAVRAGKAFKESFFPIAASSALGTAVQETMLHNSQQTRTQTESAIAVGGSFLLGGLLGAGVAASMSRSAFNKLASQLEREVADVIISASDQVKTGIVKTAAGEISADIASVPPAGIQSIFKAMEAGDVASSIYGAGKYLAAPVKWLNPILRGNTSPSLAVREIMNGMVENATYINKNFDDVASPQAVETIMKEFTRGAMADAIGSQRTIFREAKKAGFNESYAVFSERVGRAMRNGDFDEGGSQHVTQAAQAWRNKVFEPLKDKAIKAGLLPKDVDPATALSYFTRVYNTRKITARENDFKGIVKTWADGAIQREMNRLQAQHNRAVNTLTNEIQEMEMVKLRRQTEAKERKINWGADTDIDDDTIKTAVRLVQQGKRPTEPQTLTQFLHKMGGLVEENDVLKQLGITNNARPGFVRIMLGQNKDKAGISIDDAIDAAVKAGFFETKPSRLEFLEHLSEDFFRKRRVVAKTDRPAAERANIYDQVVATVNKLGLDIKDPKFKTTANLNKLLDNVVHELNARTDLELSSARLRLSKITDEFTELKKNKFDQGVGRDKYIDDIANSVFDKITGRSIEELPTNLSVTTRGPLKERTFDIPDKLIQEFLIDDVEHVAHRYSRVMSADIELTTKYGSTDMKYPIQIVRNEYEQLRQNINAMTGKDQAYKEKALAYLTKREKDDVQDIRDMRDLLRGQYQERSANSNWSRIVYVLNSWNYLRAMGGVVISSLVDAGRPIMVHGFKDTLGVGVPTLVANLKGFRMAVEEARLAGSVAESLLNTRIATLAEVMDPYSAASPFERWMANLSSGFSRINGMVYWNDFHKSFASILTQNRILRNVENWGAMGAKEKAYMHMLGIDQDMGKRILAEYTRAATDNPTKAGLIKNVRVAGTESWTDIEARSAFRAAMNKDVDSTIVTRGYGDIPTLANTPTGKLLLQFRSFALASHQRVLMRGVQENHAGVYLGALSTILGGMMVYALKNFESNKDFSDNPGTWIAEGLDRSGLFSLFFEVNNAWEKLGAPGVYRSLARLSPDASQKPPASRFAARTAIAGFMGPSAGLLEELAQVASVPFKKDIAESDIQSASRVTFGRTLLLWRSFLDYKVLPYLKDELVKK